MPEGWEIQNLFDIADVGFGFPFKSRQFTDVPNGRPVVRIRNVNSGTSDTYTTEEADSRYHVENGDILVGMDGDFHMCRWAGGPAYLNQRVARFRPKIDIPKYLLYLALEDPIDYLNRTVTGTTVAHLSAKNLRSIEIPMPLPGLLMMCHEVFDPLFDLGQNLVLRSKQLAQTRDLLLPRLISGQVGVASQMDEPVEVGA